MIVKKKIVAIAAAIIATGAIGGGIATANAATTPTGSATSSVQVDAPDAPGAVDVPEAGDTPDAPGAVDVPEAGDTPDAPGAVDLPEAGDTPDAPGAVDLPGAGDTPDAPVTK